MTVRIDTLLNETRQEFLVRVAPYIQNASPEFVRDTLREYLVNGQLHLETDDGSFVTFNDDYVTRLSLLTVLSAYSYRHPMQSLIDQAAKGFLNEKETDDFNPAALLRVFGEYAQMNLYASGYRASHLLAELTPEGDFWNVMNEAVDEMLDLMSEEAPIVSRDSLTRKYGERRLMFMALSYMQKHAKKIADAERQKRLSRNGDEYEDEEP